MRQLAFVLPSKPMKGWNCASKTKEGSLPHRLLTARLDYNELTGVFTWRSHGSIAGSLDAKGYRRIRIGAKTYRAHRLAWFYVHCEWPENQLDHINRNRDDNALSNLRPASPESNGRNNCYALDISHGISRSGSRFKIAFWTEGRMEIFGYRDSFREAVLFAAEVKARLGYWDHVGVENMV